MVDFFLTRHGETSWNVEQRVQGLTDVPLTPEGEEQARRLAARLADGAEGIKRIYSSDLSRALRTAEIINERLGVEIEIDETLRERNWGCLEGLTWKEIVRDHPHDAKHISSSDMDFAPEGGESRYQVARRVVGWLNRVVEANEGGAILAVTHGGVSSYIVKNALEIDFPKKTPFAIDNCSLTSLTYLNDSRWFINYLNDRSHLTLNPPR